MFKMKKMKKMFKFFMTVAAIAAITSCSNEEIISGEGSVNPNEKAALTVMIAGGGQATRALDDTNATTDELKVSNATIFVFSAQNAYQADTTVVLSQHATTTDNVYEVEFHVPTGNNKRVYVAINFSAAMTNLVKTNGLAALTYPITAQEGHFYGTGTNFGGNPMFNDHPAYVDVKAGQTTNRVNVAVERLTAKVTVQKESGSNLALGDIKASNATFTSASLKFAMGNKNTKILPMREQSNWIDPNWDGNYALYGSDFQHEFQVFGKAWNQWDVTKFVDVDDATTAKLSKTKYAFENTHKLAQQGEVTYVAILAKFKPDSIATWDDVNNTPITARYAAGTSADDSVFVVVDNNAFYYYADKSEAIKHTSYLTNLLPQGQPQISYTTYYNLTCFYRVWLNSVPSSKEYQAKRNEYYNVGLSDISRLGTPYPEIEPGTETEIIGATASITVKITVNPWTLVNMGGTVLGN
jgi:hypothetical protein